MATIKITEEARSQLEGVGNISSYVSSLIEGRAWTIEKAVNLLRRHKIDDARRAELVEQFDVGVEHTRGRPMTIADAVKILVEEEAMGRTVSTDAVV